MTERNENVGHLPKHNQDPISLTVVEKRLIVAIRTAERERLDPPDELEGRRFDIEQDPAILIQEALMDLGVLP